MLKHNEVIGITFQAGMNLYFANVVKVKNRQTTLKKVQIDKEKALQIQDKINQGRYPLWQRA